MEPVLLSSKIHAFGPLGLSARHLIDLIHYIILLWVRTDTLGPDPVYWLHNVFESGTPGIVQTRECYIEDSRSLTICFDVR